MTSVLTLVGWKQILNDICYNDHKLPWPRRMCPCDDCHTLRNKKCLEDRKMWLIGDPNWNSWPDK